MLAAAVSEAAACPPARLRIAIPAANLRQGAIFPVTVRSDARVDRGTLHDGNREIPLTVSEDGRTLRALVGIDFESAPGPRTLRVEAVTTCGQTQRAVRRARVVSGRFPVQSLKVDPAYVEPPESERERIRLDREKVARVWAAADTAPRWRGAFRKPVAAAAPGDFGAKRVFNGKPRSRHNGVDLAAPEGAEVVAPAPAVVALADELYFSGGTVILDHGSGLFTTYFHLSAIDVPPGTEVAAGQRVGAVGATGRATGPHLHWGARLHGARVNPLDLLSLPATTTGD
jgi:murein DD-endopeptidase MepM/ murein hydrolase activator NlpD